MIFVTALTFLAVGYLLGVMQHQPQLPHDAFKAVKTAMHPERVGSIKRPSAQALAKRDNPVQAATEAAMKETLDELL